MKVELNVLELEYLNVITNGSPSPSLVQLLLDVRRNALMLSDAQALNKHEVAIVAALHQVLGGGLNEPVEPPLQQLADRLEEHLGSRSRDMTPADEVTEDEKEALERQNQNLDHTATGGEYKGPRLEWSNAFTSTPQTPISQLEYGRPITYISLKDGRERAGRFVRVNRDDKTKANILSSEQKKPFGVPMQNIRVTDLTRPSTEPRAVQL